MDTTCLYCNDNIIYPLGRCKKHTCFGYTKSENGVDYVYLCDNAAKKGNQCDDCQRKQKEINYSESI